MDERGISIGSLTHTRYSQRSANNQVDLNCTLASTDPSGIEISVARLQAPEYLDGNTSVRQLVWVHPLKQCQVLWERCDKFDLGAVCRMRELELNYISGFS